MTNQQTKPASNMAEQQRRKQCSHCKLPMLTKDEPRWEGIDFCRCPKPAAAREDIVVEEPPVEFWALKFRERGKQTLAFSFDGPRSSSYVAYVKKSALDQALATIDNMHAAYTHWVHENETIESLKEQLAAVTKELEECRKQKS